jgi:ankyrin repeat protein
MAAYSSFNDDDDNDNGNNDDFVYACATGDEAKVLELLDGGQYTNVTDKWGYIGPVRAAMRGGQPGIITLLLNKGAEPNVKDKGGQYLLHWAVLRNDAKLVKLILERWGNSNADDRYNCTPLHYAAFNGYLEIAILLLKYKADPNATDHLDKTPMYFAKNNGHVELVSLLLDNRAYPEAKDPEGRPPYPLPCTNPSELIIIPPSEPIIA